jgi:hypothetical protein
MQGGQWKQTKELQESAQEDRAKSIALEAGMKLLESMGRSGKEVTPELAQYATDLMGAFSAAMGIETTSEMNAEMARMFTTPQTELERKTLPEREKQVGLQTAGMEQGLEAGAIDIMTKTQELDYLPALMESRLTLEGARTGLTEAQIGGAEAQPEAIRAQAAASRASAEATTEGMKLIEPRKALIEAETDKTRQEIAYIEAQISTALTGTDPATLRALNDKVRVVLTMGKNSKGVPSRQAVEAAMLMYEQAGIALPWTVESVMTHPAWWARLWAWGPGADYKSRPYLKDVMNYKQILGVPGESDEVQQTGEEEAAAGFSILLETVPPEDIP